MSSLSSIREHITGMDVSKMPCLAVMFIPSSQVMSNTMCIIFIFHVPLTDTSMERTDGFQGPIIISNPDSDDEKQLRTMYDHEAVVFLQDW